MLLFFADAFGFTIDTHSNEWDNKEFGKQGIFVGLKSSEFNSKVGNAANALAVLLACRNRCC